MIDVVLADLDDSEHQSAVLALTSAYAEDPMGAGAPLPAAVKERLIPGLRGHPTTEILLALEGGEPIGIATCFRGFSTFQALPLLNVHDLAVLPAHRGRGVGRRLLEAVEARARMLGCGKITLEVQENNTNARRTYAAAGFKQAEAGPGTGGALFYAKLLAPA
jgi:GNAT superfamily N-acetyltransferase